MINKDIYYLETYNNNKVKTNLGFIKIEDKKITINIKKSAYDTIEIKEVIIETINGAKRQLEIKRESKSTQLIYIGHTNLSKEEINQITVTLNNNNILVAIIQNRNQEVHQIVNTSNYDTNVNIIPTIEEDKWNEIYKNHQKLHIYPEADTIMIKPGEMIILTSQYHNLANNSFVLHSYYNYRQLLLFRYNQKNKVEYYLGVPGIFHDRDKRVAMMFGFEGFENGESRFENEDKRDAYNGCFGYYMKKVDI